MAKEHVGGEIQSKTGNMFYDTIELIGAPIILRTLLGLSLICFALPFVTVSCSSNQIASLSGVNVAMGSSLQVATQEIRVLPQMFVILSILFTALALVLAVMQSSSRTMLTATAISAGLGALWLIIFIIAFPFIAAEYLTVALAGLFMAVSAQIVPVPLLIIVLLGGAVFFSWWQIQSMMRLKHLDTEQALFPIIAEELIVSEMERKRNLTEIALASTAGATLETVSNIFTKEELEPVANVNPDEFKGLVPGSYEDDEELDSDSFEHMQNFSGQMMGGLPRFGFLTENLDMPPPKIYLPKIIIRGSQSATSPAPTAPQYPQYQVPTQQQGYPQPQNPQAPQQPYPQAPQQPYPQAPQQVPTQPYSQPSQYPMQPQQPGGPMNPGMPQYPQSAPPSTPQYPGSPPSPPTDNQ